MSHSPDHHPPSTNDRTVEAYCKALEAEMIARQAAHDTLFIRMRDAEVERDTLQAEVERLTRAWQAMQLAKSKAEASEKEVWNERETLRTQLAAAQAQEPVAEITEVYTMTGVVEWKAHTGQPIYVGHNLYAAPIPQQPAQPLTDKQIEHGWKQTFSTENPFCPCNLKSFTKAVRWALAAAPQPKEPK